MKLRQSLIITDEVGENLYLSSRNLLAIDIRDVAAVDPVSLVGMEKKLLLLLLLETDLRSY